MSTGDHHDRKSTAAPKISLCSTVLGIPDPEGLARFYRGQLGWESVQADSAWVQLAGPEDEHGRLSFQLETIMHVRSGRRKPAGNK